MIGALDHLVLTVRDLDSTIDFYCRGLGMRKEVFGNGRVAIHFGEQKFNLHEADGAPILPRARNPVAGGGDFCLVAEVGDAIRFDGYLAIGIADISTIEADPAREFVDRALALRGEALRVPADFVLDDWATIARSAAAIAPLVSVNMVEDEDGEISYVGELVDVDANALVLREIDPNAEWYPDTGAYEFEAIGSIGFGSGYLDALWQVAGGPGGPLSPRVPASDTVH